MAGLAVAGLEEERLNSELLKLDEMFSLSVELYLEYLFICKLM